MQSNTISLSHFIKHWKSLNVRLYGSYEALRGGSSSEAMEDFTGGLTEVYDLRESLPDGFHRVLLSSYKMCSLLSASLEVRTTVVSTNHS